MVRARPLAVMEAAGRPGIVCVREPLPARCSRSHTQCSCLQEPLGSLCEWAAQLDPQKTRAFPSDSSRGLVRCAYEDLVEMHPAPHCPMYPSPCCPLQDSSTCPVHWPRPGTPLPPCHIRFKPDSYLRVHPAPTEDHAAPTKPTEDHPSPTKGHHASTKPTEDHPAPTKPAQRQPAPLSPAPVHPISSQPALCEFAKPTPPALAGQSCVQPGLSIAAHLQPVTGRLIYVQPAVGSHVRGLEESSSAAHASPATGSLATGSQRTACPSPGLSTPFNSVTRLHTPPCSVALPPCLTSSFDLHTCATPVHFLSSPVVFSARDAHESASPVIDLPAHVSPVHAPTASDIQGHVLPAPVSPFHTPATASDSNTTIYTTSSSPVHAASAWESNTAVYSALCSSDPHQRSLNDNALVYPAAFDLRIWPASESHALVHSASYTDLWVEQQSIIQHFRVQSDTQSLSNNGSLIQSLSNSLENTWHAHDQQQSSNNKYKKRVQFVDSLGQDLVSIKHFSTAEEVPGASPPVSPAAAAPVGSHLHSLLLKEQERIEALLCEQLVSDLKLEEIQKQERSKQAPRNQDGQPLEGDEDAAHLYSCGWTLQAAYATRAKRLNTHYLVGSNCTSPRENDELSQRMRLDLLY